jgi:hypothetical protein
MCSNTEHVIELLYMSETIRGGTDNFFPVRWRFTAHLTETNSGTRRTSVCFALKKVYIRPYERQRYERGRL